MGVETRTLITMEDVVRTLKNIKPYYGSKEEFERERKCKTEAVRVAHGINFLQYTLFTLDELLEGDDNPFQEYSLSFSGRNSKKRHCCIG